MAGKKYSITQYKFQEWLLRTGKDKDESFDDRESLPGSLFESQMNDEDLINCVDMGDINIQEIELKK